jgi:ribosomal protein S18 acetylase RimI-like enzyme
MHHLPRHPEKGSVILAGAVLLVARATAEGVKSIDLTSRPSRKDANRLYERLGFVVRDSKVYRFQRKPGSG